MICFECFKVTCSACNDDGDSGSHIQRCAHCDLTFCEDNAEKDLYDRPDPNVCYNCGKFHCHLCSKLDHVGSAQAVGVMVISVMRQFAPIASLKAKNVVGKTTLGNAQDA